jgi:hypothetical protein
VWSSDDSAPGPPVVPDFTASDGQLEPAAGTEYMVADSGITPVGKVVARKKHFGGRGARTWTLVKITPPLRLRRTIDGVYPDGWGAPNTALNQFSFGSQAPRKIKVHVFRTGAARRYPATVRVTLGSLVLAGPTGGRKPSIQSVITTKTIRVPNNLDHTFEFSAPPPTRSSATRATSARTSSTRLRRRHRRASVSGCLRTKRAMPRQCQSVRRVRKRASVARFHSWWTTAVGTYQRSQPAFAAR